MNIKNLVRLFCKIFNLPAPTEKAESEKFQLRIVPYGGIRTGSQYICFEYTINGGRSWKTIQRCDDFASLSWLTEDSKMETLIYQLGDGDFTAEKARFSTYDKIQKYEEDERKRMKETNESWQRQRDILQQKRQDALKRANQ